MRRFNLYYISSNYSDNCLSFTSFRLYVQVVETYARQLIAKQEKLKAVGYLLLIGQNEEAINIIKAIMA